MTLNLGFVEISMGLVLLGALQYVIQLWLSERLKTSLQKEQTAFLERLKWDLKVREQAVGVAEYLALVNSIRDDSPDDYRKANQMALELAMWLPARIYREMGHGIMKPSPEINNLTTVVKVRELLLGESIGNLTSDDILWHAPGVGRTIDQNQPGAKENRPNEVHSEVPPNN
jgi:hypothetical protein